MTSVTRNHPTIKRFRPFGSTAVMQLARAFEEIPAFSLTFTSFYRGLTNSAPTGSGA